MMPSIRVFCAFLAFGAFIPLSAQVPNSSIELGIPFDSSTPVANSSRAEPRHSVEDVPFNVSREKRIWQRPSIKTVVIATVLTAGFTAPYDGQIASRARTLSGSGSHLGGAVSTLNWIGGPGSIVLPVTVATLGMVTQQPDIKDMGVHVTESVLLSAGVTTLLKGVVGRTRPSQPGIDPDHFAFRSGFQRNTATSFPSGHTTAAFAMATTLTLETARMHPKAKWILGLSSFGIASGVGLARVYSDRHWSSDVLVGAGIGTLSGMVLDHMHHNPQEHFRLLEWLH